ncbi:MAG: alpha-galactosidase [bacterium]
MNNFKIAIIGAGSLSFTRKLMGDILTVEAFNNIDITMMDINEKYLEMTRKLCQKDINENGLDIKIETTLDQREAVTDAKYVINCARVGLLEGLKMDVEIPLKYGVSQCVGDTLGPGGIMYGQRGIPMVLELCKDIREAGDDDCILLNYANPNAMITWACNHYGNVKTMGLCHGVMGGHALLAQVLEVPQEELNYTAAGINHQTWFIQLQYKGEDMTDKVLPAFESHPEILKHEKVRVDMLRRFGYFSTESNGHLSEYLPWYRKDEDELQNWIPDEEDRVKFSDGASKAYYEKCYSRRNEYENNFEEWLQKPSRKFKEENRSREHGSYIMEGLETGKRYRGHFNVVNQGVIDNLADDAIVEVPGYIDATGINIPRVGSLPAGCAAVCSTSINTQRLSVKAALKGDYNLLIQAMMMDPLTGAILTPPEIEEMTREMLQTEKKWLPQYEL